MPIYILEYAHTDIHACLICIHTCAHCISLCIYTQTFVHIIMSVYAHIYRHTYTIEYAYTHVYSIHIRYCCSYRCSYPSMQTPLSAQGCKLLAGWRSNSAGATVRTLTCPGTGVSCHEYLHARRRWCRPPMHIQDNTTHPWVTPLRHNPETHPCTPETHRCYEFNATALVNQLFESWHTTVTRAIC